MGRLGAITLVILAMTVQTAAAQQRALFRLHHFNNWLDVTYDFDYGRTRTRGAPALESTQHRVEETLHLGADYAVYHPRFLKGSLSADLGLKQDVYREPGRSGSDSGELVEYRVDGVFLERHPYPVDFFAGSAASRVIRRFAKSYDQTVDARGAGLTLRSTTFPARLLYRYRSTETEGLGLDRLETSETAAFTGTHRAGDLSRTTLFLSHTSGGTTFTGAAAPITVSRNTAAAANNLSWTSGERGRNLDTSFSYAEDTGSSPTRAADWGENIAWDLGRALKWSLRYEGNRYETETFERREHRGQTWLEHRLFQSLTTRIGAGGARTTYLSGRETHRSAFLNVSYRKRLPAASRLSLFFSLNRDVTDRDVKARFLEVRDERLTVDPLGNLLEKTDIDPATVQVWNETRTVRYSPGVDYDLHPVGRRLELLPHPGGGVSVGDVLSVDYTYTVNPSIRYRTVTHGLGATLQLFRNRYRVFVNYTGSDQDLLGGSDEAIRLDNTAAFVAGMEAAYRFHTLGLEYDRTDSRIERTDSTSAYWRYARYLGGHYVGWAVRDTWRRFEDADPGARSTSGHDNSLGASAFYRRQAGRRSFFSAEAEFLDYRGRGRDRDTLNLRLTYQVHLRRTELSLFGETTWEDYEDTRQTTARLGLRIRRTF
ncbi:hypothetical protein G3N55_00915 [Dissulfurirhabdus thermomarina]|uniref:TIGR03016 family PEP-CTERM system-associated outer membrane protein n=1 Tax=Dissulfurirhabdus thermomarina TaxID=1765737 RepID=A0A6N9TMW5_DISTH|nr:hypothetical protein [Dissulfurirhabdus thermomarina]NDY41413.1 hypothetical protein [Dissulfurirhabdus thermomarina]NMX24401.1 hypothetical protein [Dissulfurirhabdus thermomarina]